VACAVWIGSWCGFLLLGPAGFFGWSEYTGLKRG
jgi:hypothetical protein